MIKPGWMFTDSEFEELRGPLSAKVLTMDLPACRTVLAMLIGACPEELARVIALHDNVMSMPRVSS